MNLQKVTFKNKDGDTLVGRVELPADQEPHNFALFAHCFSCNKNLLAVKNIVRALTAQGFGVLRFDFTGLGESEGDFSDTNLSGNVEDLLSAATFLKEKHKAPSLIIGHSLGGVAALMAAKKIASVKGIATIGTPSNAEHVKGLLKNDIDEIEETGKACVNLGGRDFTIKKQFLEDLENQSLLHLVKELRLPILLLHSPLDTTVGIDHAEALYKAAHHPKSFVSLDDADHLLMEKMDSDYAGGVIAAWSKKYMDNPAVSVLDTSHQVVGSLDADDLFTTKMKVGSHYLTADEPVSVGGQNFGPAPHELVAAGLTACTVMTIQMYAKRKGWNLDNAEVHTTYSKSASEEASNENGMDGQIDTFKRDIKLTGELDEKQKKRILEIANKCPVHKTLTSPTQIVSRLMD
ncbi:bifunctional alpha/beta hydrolase/OsmC family protein [Sediminicola sp. 1XM1-17]|uniref:bifunctional alpha/beta hydrolase/OsmC family protein n=1 Tax=Sediminicola sp. 1XM1-17 TaxID=3127702 RepID=UPI00307696C6